jgi:hypothetical protein
MISALLPKPKLSTDPKITLGIDEKKGRYVFRTLQGETDLTFSIASDQIIHGSPTTPAYQTKCVEWVRASGL